MIRVPLLLTIGPGSCGLCLAVREDSKRCPRTDDGRLPFHFAATKYHKIRKQLLNCARNSVETLESENEVPRG